MVMYDTVELNIFYNPTIVCVWRTNGEYPVNDKME